MCRPGGIIQHFGIIPLPLSFTIWLRVKDVADGLPDPHLSWCQHYWIKHIFYVQYLSTEETVLLFLSPCDLADWTGLKTPAFLTHRIYIRKSFKLLFSCSVVLALSLKTWFKTERSAMHVSFNSGIPSWPQFIRLYCRIWLHSCHEIKVFHQEPSAGVNVKAHVCRLWLKGNPGIAVAHEQEMCWAISLA